MPPVDAGNTTLTSFDFPANLTLVDSSNQPVSSLATFVDILGTPGSGSIATAEPYLFDGTSYSQVPTLITGTAYFIKNNSASPVTLLFAGNGATLSARSRAEASAPASGAVYTDRGQPPSMPASNASSSSSGGCGTASGAGLLGALALLGLRRRRRTTAC